MVRRGVVCPVDNRTITDAECLACRNAPIPARGMDRWCDYSYEMLNGMFKGSEGRETAHTSATELSGCARRTRLEKTEDYYLSPIALYPAFRGTLGHLAMENYPDTTPGVIYEHRFECKIEGFDTPLTGKFDKLSIPNRTIEDAKSKADDKIPSAPDKNHIFQTNVYRYLAMHGWPQEPFSVTLENGDQWEFPIGVAAEIEIDNLQINYFSMKKTASFSTRINNAVPILSDDEIMTYIVRGMTLIQGKVLPPIPEDLNPVNHPLCTIYCGLAEPCIDALTKFVR